MIALVPKWAHNYDEFWIAIRKRNLWFIHLRYLFVALLFSFLIFSEFIYNLQLTSIQHIALSSIAISILAYNLILHYFRPLVGRVPGHFNCMHLSLIQMVLDLTSLMLLVYFTGIIYSPFHTFFIFQIVIGSMILRGRIVSIITALTIIAFAILTFMQHYDIVTTHIILGFYDETVTHNLTYIFQYLFFFSIMLFFLVYLANSITQRLYKRERQLRESLVKLDQAETTKQKYIMGVVHEIKSPIAAVQSILDLILKKFLGPVEKEIEDKLWRAHHRSDEAIRLINNVLRISKIKLLNDAAAEELCVVEIIERIIEKKLDNAKSKKIKINIEDFREERMLIKGDPLLLEVALSNIIGNSIKYGREKGNISIQLKEQDTDHLFINISDDGIGIPKNELDTIFKQFYRASNVKGEDSFEGSGMGLAVVKEIIEHHGGSIEIVSPSNIGSSEYPGTSVNIVLPETRVKSNKRLSITMYD